MPVIETNLGWSVADAEGAELHTHRGDQVLRFVDWREQPVDASVVGDCYTAWQEGVERCTRDPVFAER